MAMAQGGRQRRVLATGGLFHGSENHRVATRQPNQQGLIPGRTCCHVPLKPLAHDRGALRPACQQPLHAVRDQAQRPAQSRLPLGSQEPGYLRLHLLCHQSRCSTLLAAPAAVAAPRRSLPPFKAASPRGVRASAPRQRHRLLRHPREPWLVGRIATGSDCRPEILESLQDGRCG